MAVNEKILSETRDSYITVTVASRPTRRIPNLSTWIFRVGNKGLIAIAAGIIVGVMILGGVTVAIVGRDKFITPTNNNSPVESEVNDPTLDWKTYTSTHLGVTFKYPPEYFQNLEDYGRAGLFLSTQNGIGGSDAWLSLTKSPANGVRSVEEYLTAAKNNSVFYDKASRRSISIGGIRGYILRSSLGEGTPPRFHYEAITWKNGEVYRVIFSAVSTGVLSSHESEFDLIAESLTFAAEPDQ